MKDPSMAESNNRSANEAREREDRPALPCTSVSPADGVDRNEVREGEDVLMQDGKVEVEVPEDSEVEVEEADELVDSDNNSAHKAQAARKGKASAAPKHDNPEVDKSAPKWEGHWTLLMPAKFMGKWRCTQCKKSGATECVIRGLKRRCDACTVGHRSPCKIKINTRKRMAVSLSKEMLDSPGKDNIVSRAPQSGKAKTAAKPKTKVATPVSRTLAKSATAMPNKRTKVDATQEAMPSSAKTSAHTLKPGPFNAKNVKASQKTAENKSTHTEARETITINSDSEDDQPLRALVAGAASRPDAPEDVMDIDELQVVDGKGKSRAGNPGQLPEVVQNDSQPDDHGFPWHGNQNVVVTMGWLGTQWKGLMEQIQDRIEDEVESALGYQIAKMQTASSKPQVPASQPHQLPEDVMRRPWYPKYFGLRPTPMNNLKGKMLALRALNAAASSSLNGAARSSSNATALTSRNAAASLSKDGMAAFAPDTPTPKQRGGGSTRAVKGYTHMYFNFCINGSLHELA
ncbi:hypothetical protein EVJ58_g2862 [Rhodofomes roseus]|uniref:Uncharacterized protein n=1 Tax=Rhodofomes roseus TaxID=34475 RepID=A0A4Y9YSJ8_9APHY|nr:hypothetical protein EVJ58_g2862 [Rhodofomes roseus]